MPIEMGVWRLGAELSRVEFQSIESEEKLEDTLASDLSLVAPNLLLVGRQVPTAHGKFIDLLAMDRDGVLVVIELKRDRTPRDVVAQALDYASWVQGLSYDEISALYASKHNGQAFEVGFDETFNCSPPEDLNVAHKIVVVASELDPSSERIIGYLSSNYGVPINTVFFRYFSDKGNDYLTRSWLIDPQQAETQTSNSTSKKRREPWNGRDFYVSIGEGGFQNWDDCRSYGFISGSGGKWYTQTLEALFPGAYVFANIPKLGYVGVGRVTEHSTRIRDFTVAVNGSPTPLLDAPLLADNMAQDVNDDELCSYCVRVEWINAVPRDRAYWEKGLFASQHTACKLSSSFTIEKLTTHFGIDD